MDNPPAFTASQKHRLDPLEIEGPQSISRHKSELFHAQRGHFNPHRRYTDRFERVQLSGVPALQFATEYDAFSRLSAVRLRYGRVLGVQHKALYVHDLSSHVDSEDGSAGGSGCCGGPSSTGVRN